MSGSEPSDAIRVVNALLTQLDQIKRHSNVIILTTSNITGAIDLAFVDRYTHIHTPLFTSFMYVYIICILPYVMLVVYCGCRADIKQYIGLPSAAAIFKIYHSCIQELMRVQ